MTNLAIKIIPSDATAYCVFGIKLTSIKSKKVSPSPEVLLLNHKHTISNFINMLHDPYRGASFTIRYIINPHSSLQSLGKIEIVLLVKFPVNNGSINAEEQAAQLYTACKQLLGGTFSYYLWKEIVDPAELETCLCPIEWNTAYIAEVRRREENVQLDTLYTAEEAWFRC